MALTWLLSLNFLNEPPNYMTKFSKSVFFYMGFTPCKTEQPLQGMESQKKEAQKD